MIPNVNTMCSMVDPCPDSMTDAMSFCILAESNSPSTDLRKISSGGISE